LDMKVFPLSFDARVGHEIGTGAMARVPRRSMRSGETLRL
jgi:hypothetical protein